MAMGALLLRRPNSYYIKLVTAPASVNCQYETAPQMLKSAVFTTPIKVATTFSMRNFSSTFIAIRPNPLLTNLPKQLEIIQKRNLFKKFITWPTPKFPFNYVRKEKTPVYFESGDLLEKNEEVDVTLPRQHFQMSTELQTANDDVKRFFSLSMVSSQERNEYKLEQLLRKVRRHPFDEDSEEVIITKLTFRIRKLLPHVRTNVPDKRSRVILNNTVLSRNKKVKLLRRADYARFKWLVDTLQIEYKPPLVGIKDIPETRKMALRKMTQDYCNGIRNKRLNAYHEILKAQQAEFLKDKEEVMTNIQETEEKFKKEDEQKLDLLIKRI